MTRPTPADRRKARAQARGRRPGRTVTGRTRRSTLARNYTRNAETGRLSGSTDSPQFTAARELRYTLRKCPWCRSTCQRPIYTGTGPVKYVRGYATCSHLWSVPDGGPGQKGLDRHDRLECTACDSRGYYKIWATLPGAGVAVEKSLVCQVCAGWVVAWNTRRGPKRRRALARLGKIVSAPTVTHVL